MTVKERINILKTLNKDSEITVSVSEDELDGYVNHLKETLTNDQDRQSYAGSWIAMRWNYQDYEEFTLSQDGLQAIKTSDGHTYTFEKDGANISHLWKNEDDIIDWGSQPVRWVIYYYNADNINDTNTILDYEKQCNVIYVFGLDVTYTSNRDISLVYNNYELLTFDFIDDFNINAINNNWSYFCYYCTSLQKLPENLDTSSGTSFIYFCYYCTSLQKLPDNLDTSKGTNFWSFCNSCFSLQKLPDNLDTSNGTDFNNFCHGCRSLQKLPENLDTSKGTNFGYFCSGCSSLQKLPDNLDTSKGTYFEWFCYYCTSLQKLPDNLDTSKGTYFWSFCYYCTSLQKLPDNLDTSKGTNFDWFCSNCMSLQKLPDNLDTSKGTNFLSFCNGCSSLQKLPDNLDTSKGTDFWSFCSGCTSLQELPDRLDTSKGINFESFCENCYSLQELPDNLDTSNGLEFIRFCGNCYSLTQANIKLASQDYENLNDSGSLTVSSMRYMADNAPTVTSNTITLGETNIARANKYDPTIIETFTSKGWTVN